MKNSTDKNTMLLIFAAAVFVVTATLSSPPAVKAYSYLGYKWNSYPVSVDVSDASFPQAWSSPVANAMSAWNAASSPFYFNIGYSGHQIKSANLGNNGHPATTSVNYTGSQLNDVDTVFNTYYPWSTTGAPSVYDVQSAATHELGHWLSLGDLYGSGDTEKTMYYQIATGETKKRTLETDDLNGINYIYP